MALGGPILFPDALFELGQACSHFATFLIYARSGLGHYSVWLVRARVVRLARWGLQAPGTGIEGWSNTAVAPADRQRGRPVTADESRSSTWDCYLNPALDLQQRVVLLSDTCAVIYVC